MKTLSPALIAVALAVSSLHAQPQAENVAAFARLYGVARWFYPGNAAATLDWNRFAVHGVSRVRTARTSAELEKVLEELFTPLGPGIDIGTRLASKPATGPRDPALVAWHYYGAGITENIPGPYRAKRMNRAPTARGPRTAPGVLAQLVRVDTLRGKTVRLRAKVRVADPAASGSGGLWLRVDRENRQTGFFENMQDRPVRDTAWREYTIEGPIAPDAVLIAFGILATGATIVDVDDLELAVRDAAGGSWTPLAIHDASFDSTESVRRSERGAWVPTGGDRITRPTTGAAHGTQFVRLAPPSAAPPAPAVPADSLETPVAGATVDVELARRLRARVPLTLTDEQARVEPAALAALRAAVAQVAPPSGRNDADVRLADAVVAWNVFRHFYPYWTDIGLDWDTRLRPHLQAALDAADSREAHLDALRLLVADLRDGHGGVQDVVRQARIAVLPVQVRVLGDRVVVTATSDASVPVGSVITAIAGTPAMTRVEREMRLASGTPQWRRYRAETALRTCVPDSAVALTIETPAGSPRDVTLRCPRAALTRMTESRPDSIAELEPGIWYVDLTRLRAAQFRPVLDTLSKARGVVFDLRGYPTDVGFAVLPYLIRAAEDSSDRWMHVARFARPFGEVAAWQHMSWNLRPAQPHIGGQRVFLTDGRAISYAESVMGHVRDHELGTIIGGTTAGANGNVAGFSVPGGFQIVFTGMRVTRHDGRSPYHTHGVSPNIPLEPTLEGIRAGRDEVLERALAVLRAGATP